MKTLFVITLLALAPAGAMAGGIPAGNTGPTATLDGLFAAQFGTNVVVERRATCVSFCGAGRR